VKIDSRPRKEHFLKNGKNIECKSIRQKYHLPKRHFAESTIHFGKIFRISANLEAPLVPLAVLVGRLVLEISLVKMGMLTFARQNFTSTLTRRIFDRLRENFDEIAR
jgi:hypothetical protein